MPIQGYRHGTQTSPIETHNPTSTMNIRKELAPKRADKATVDALTALATEIARLLDTRGDYLPVIARFNDVAATNLTIADFDAMAGSMDEKQFVREILSPYPKIHADITDAEYLAIIHALRNYDEIPDHQTTYWETFLEINLRCRSIDDLLNDEDLTDEQVLDQARKNKPIQL